MFKKQQILQQNTNCHSKKWNNLAKKPLLLFFFGIVTTSCWLKPWFNFKPDSHIVVIVSEKNVLFYFPMSCGSSHLGFSIDTKTHIL